MYLKDLEGYVLDTLTLLIYAIPPAGLLGLHLGLVYWMRRKTSAGVALVGLVCLSLCVTVLWYAVAYPLAYMAAECCAGLPTAARTYEDLYTWTIGLPFSLCYNFPALEIAWGLTVCNLLHYALLPASLFLLGLMPVAFAQPRKPMLLQ
jgi:hypothetical protein